MKLLRSNDKTFPYLMLLTGALTFYAIRTGFSWHWWLLSLVGYFLNTCCGISVTFHRKLAHRSYSAPKWLVYLFSFFAAMGGTGSSIGWVAVHRTHHKYADSEQDPHSPNTGSVWGIFLNKYNFVFNKWIVRDLLVQPFHLYLHLYYYGIIAAWLALLYLIEPRVCLFFGIIPMFYLYCASSISVILGHTHGYRRYNIPDKSRNSWLNSLLVWGEGWHNNHHRFPARWFFGEKWWEVDIGAIVIKAIKNV